MPNMPDINKTQISLQVSVEDDRKLVKLSEACKVSKASVAQSIMHEGLKHVELDEEDYRKIADIIAARKARRGL